MLTGTLANAAAAAPGPSGGSGCPSADAALKDAWIPAAAIAPHAGLVDLSASAFFPPIGDQGDTNSCTAWAVTYYQFGFLKAKELGWSDASAGNESHLFSPSWTYNKVNEGVDNGSAVPDIVSIIAQHGAATMDVMPFSSAADGYLNWGSEAAWRNAVQYRCQGYTLFANENTTQFIALVKQALDNGIPVNFNINCSVMGNNFADNKGNRNNIISASEYLINGSNHLQTVVGYNDSMTDLDAAPGAFKVANSYGTDFGIAGYYYITYDAFKKMANDSYCGIVNMSGSAGYSPSALATFQFNPGPTRDANLTVQAVRVSDGQTIVEFPTSFDAGNIQRMPAFMCLDISNMSQYVNQAGYDIILTVASANQSGTISSLKVEIYGPTYRAGQPNWVSPESANVPKATPGSVNAGKTLTAPSAPQDLKASSGAQQVSLSWSAPLNDGGSPITGYRVYLALAGGSQLLASLSATSLSYVHANGTVGTTYTYYVTASNAIGAGANSTQVFGSPQAASNNTLLYMGIAIVLIAIVVMAVVLVRRKK
jgi:hypothetical protein